MTSLTQVAIATRKVIRYGIFFLIFLIIGRIILGIGINLYRKIFPSPPPAPTVTWGKLPKLYFPDAQVPANISFTVETPEGGLPAFSTQAKVYFMPKISSSLLSLDVTRQKAKALGFTENEQQVSPTVYRYSRNNSPSNLEINIVNNVFSLSYDLKADPSPLENKSLVPEIASNKIRTYLSGAGLLAADLSGDTTHELLKVESEKLVAANSLSEAKLVKVNLFRKSYDNLPSLTPNPNQANVWFLVSGAQEKSKQIIAGEYHYYPIDEQKFSTYPIKTAQTAWDELIANKGFIANLGDNKEGDNLKIRRVYLAYYDAGIPAEFYQPIVVFEGDRGFKAYVPAVTADYYGQ